MSLVHVVAERSLNTATEGDNFFRIKYNFVFDSKRHGFQKVMPFFIFEIKYILKLKSVFSKEKLVGRCFL